MMFFSYQLKSLIKKYLNHGNEAAYLLEENEVDVLLKA